MLDAKEGGIEMKFTMMYDDKPLLVFEAESMDSVPTDITGDSSSVSYAKELARDFPQVTCLAIMSRFSQYGNPVLIPG